jgi:F-type H+-transporting ATPase subunit b
MELVTPGFGLVFWTTLTFIFLLLILKKYAWKPIVDAVDSRNDKIEKSLQAAEIARKEMENMHAENKKILDEAKEEKKNILAEAYQANHHIIAEARTEAQVEADRILEHARVTIESEKNIALSEIKHLMADLSVDIAKKVLQKELADENKQREYIDNILKDINLN